MLIFFFLPEYKNKLKKELPSNSQSENEKSSPYTVSVEDSVQASSAPTNAHLSNMFHTHGSLWGVKEKNQCLLRREERHST